MSDWKEKIEAQIAWLAMEPEPRTQDCAQVMRDLLDVAVAVENNLLQPKGVIYLRPPHPVAIAHKKLREASDE